MTHARRLLAVLLTALVLGTTTGGGAAGSRPAPESCRPLHVEAGYVRNVDNALRAGTDVWGTALLRARDGPTYEAARRYLTPVLFANAAHGQRLTDSGMHYLPFTQPRGDEGAGAVALHVADGGQIIADLANGRKLTINVGEGGRERYGACLARLAFPGLARGYLPILETKYVDSAGVRYQEESFVARDPATSSVASFVHVRADARRAQRDATLRFKPSVGTAVTFLVPSRTVLSAYVSWPLTPRPDRPLVIERQRYEQALGSVIEYWEQRLSRGLQIDVPEPRVLEAARALLVQNLGLTWRYSLGNQYEEFSYPEAIDVAQVMAAFGQAPVAREILLMALDQPPSRYPNWRLGQKLVGSALYYRLHRDVAYVERAAPVFARQLSGLRTQLQHSRDGILRRERYSSDVAESVYGLHAQAVVWQGLREMAEVWRETGHLALARQSAMVASQLEHGLRRATRRSERSLADGSLFLDVRLLDRIVPYRAVTASRLGSYWNLVMPYALASGLFPPRSPEANGIYRYMQLHGSRLLGLVRSGAFSLYGKEPAYPTSGVNPVYGLNVGRFLADNDRPDQLVLSLYGYLAAAMAPGTFVSGEAVSVAPLEDGRFRATYLPPNGASNASFLETLRLLLVHEKRARDGSPSGLDLAFATPRSWLAPGKDVAVRDAPTSFGPVSLTIESRRPQIRVALEIPPRARRAAVRLRLRLPPGSRIGAATLEGHSLLVDREKETIDLTGYTGKLAIVVTVGGGS